jgi:hypothetical protein
MYTIFILLFSLAVLHFIGCVQPESAISSSGGNNPPVIENVFLEPLVINVGTTATIKVNAYDPDGDQLTYSWSTALGDIIGSGSQVRYTAAFCCVGSNNISLIVSDTRGGKTTEEIRIEINP